MRALAFQSVDLALPDGRLAPGLVPVHAPTLPGRLDEASRILEARAFHKIDYVFFRRFSDGRSSQLAAFVVDNSDHQLEASQLADLHRQLWLYGSVPLLYVCWPARVDVLTCARGPDFWKRGKSVYDPPEDQRIEIGIADAIDTAHEIDRELTERRRRFSAFRLADGTFWDEPRNADLASYDKSAHQKLIQAIVEADQELHGEQNPGLRRLLMLTVLIKYLEDRRVFPRGWFEQFQPGASSFIEVLEGGDPDRLSRLLTELQLNKFNGDVFTLPTGVRLSPSDLGTFAGLVGKKRLKQQWYLWDQFTFEHVPVEVISRIYQRFVRGGRGAFYTPPFLASLLLDQAMPYDRLTGEERVLDPACGSGVFLVGAFRRLATVWRSRNQWRPVGAEVLKSILRRNIFGVELHPEAVQLAAFSLALAICDALQPEVIWNELKFEPLVGSNLQEGDFFDLIARPKRPGGEGWPERFDVIIGNPPFESRLTPGGKALNRALVKKRGSLPDQQAAYLFLEQGAGLLGDHGRLCLLQPSQILYNRKPARFRKYLFSQSRLSSVLDFTSIRNLYDGADAKTVAILIKGRLSSPQNWIEHLTFRRTLSVAEKIGFELDNYDYHRVPRQVAENDPFAWRIDLLGGGRLHEISRRIRSIGTLSEYVRGRGWDYGEGFMTATGGRLEAAAFLTGRPLLPTEALSDSGIDESKITEVEQSLFRSAYTESRYSAPLILMKENEALPMAFWDKGFLAYRDSIVGIHSPTSDRESLYQFFNICLKRRRLYQFCCALHGSKGMVGKATSILKQDIDALPVPDDESDLELSFWENALVEDVLQYLVPYIRLGQDSDLMSKEASTNDLQGYAEMFCRMLGMYENLKAREPVSLGGLWCQVFYFGDRPKASWALEGSDGILRDLIYHQQHESLRTIRKLTVYDENSVAVVKPDRLRYWIRSTAIWDADETLWDLRRRGY